MMSANTSRNALPAWSIFAMCVFAVGSTPARTLSVDLPLIPAEDQTNRLATTLAVTALNNARSDSDTATLTGNILADLEISFNPSTHEVAAVHSIEFTGGRVYMSNLSFTLSYGFLLGKIEAQSTGVSGFPSSPSGPGLVMGDTFSTIDHSFVFNEGSVSAYGTGLLGGLFDPINLDLSEEPLQASADTQGMISVRLADLTGDQAIYQVYLILPVIFTQEFPVAEGVTASFTGNGTIVAAGSFTIPICPLHSDLVGEDCRVDLSDLAAFSQQWFLWSDRLPCPLTADLEGQNCIVDLNDLAILVTEWLLSE